MAELLYSEDLNAWHCYTSLQPPLELEECRIRYDFDGVLCDQDCIVGCDVGTNCGPHIQQQVDVTRYANATGGTSTLTFKAGGASHQAFTSPFSATITAIVGTASATQTLTLGYDDEDSNIIPPLVFNSYSMPFELPSFASGPFNVTITVDSGSRDFYVAFDGISLRADLVQPTTDVPSGSGGSTNIGAIVGGVIGGLVVLGLIIGAVFFFILKRNRKAQANRVSQQPMLQQPHPGSPGSPGYGWPPSTPGFYPSSGHTSPSIPYVPSSVVYPGGVQPGPSPPAMAGVQPFDSISRMMLDFPNMISQDLESKLRRANYNADVNPDAFMTEQEWVEKYGVVGMELQRLRQIFERTHTPRQY